MFKVATFLADAGYPSLRPPSFQPYRRYALLLNLCLQRQNMKVKRVASVASGAWVSAACRAGSRTNIFFVLPYNAVTRTLRVARLWESSLASACCDLPLVMRLAWTVERNSQRRMYTLNWPGPAV